MDPVTLAQELMQYDTTSPVTEREAFDHLASRLREHGIEADIVRYGDVYNLVAREGTGEPSICFNGHADVVEPGQGWTVTDPFEPVVRDGKLYGRGAADMKAGLAAQAAAFVDLVDEDTFDGSVTLMVAGDEEQGGFNGTKRLVEEYGSCDYVVVGEPTDLNVQVGTRGVLWVDVHLEGESAHASKPHHGANPVEELPRVLQELHGLELSYEHDGFLPEPNLEVTVVETDGPQNSLPSTARIGMDIRYNTTQEAAEIVAAIEEALGRVGVSYELEHTDHGGPFRLEDAEFKQAATRAVHEATGRRPDHVTTGGASDGRFFSERGTPFIELGVRQDSVHQPDEHCHVDEIRKVREAYTTLAKELCGT